MEGLDCKGGLLIVVESGGSSHYLNYALAISGVARRFGREVFVLEIDSRRDSRFWYPFNSKKFRFLDVLVSSHTAWRIQLTEIGVRYLGRHDVSVALRFRSQSGLSKDLCKNLNVIDDILKALDIDSELARSVHSIMIQEIARGSYLAPRKIRRRASQVAEHFFQTSQLIRGTLNEFPKISQVVVPNGRAPVQAAALRTAELTNRSSLTYEHGAKRGESVFLASWRYHDRLRFQQNLGETETAGLIEFGKTELIRWRSDSNLNPYLFNETKNDRNLQERQSLDLPLAVYFVSSADEFVSSGPNWPKWRWLDQWEALSEVIPFLQQSGYRVIIKQHPNLLNKSWKEAACQNARSQSYGVHYVDAFDKISAHELIEQSSLILTWGSTVGIEGIAAGKPVWLLSHCHYDLTVDVRMWPRVGLPESTTLEYVPNSDSAFAWYGFANSLGTQLQTLDPNFNYDNILRADYFDQRANRFNRCIQLALLPWILFATPRIALKITRTFLGVRASNSIIRRILSSSFLARGSRIVEPNGRV